MAPFKELTWVVTFPAAMFQDMQCNMMIAGVQKHAMAVRAVDEHVRVVRTENKRLRCSRNLLWHAFRDALGDCVCQAIDPAINNGSDEPLHGQRR